MPAQSEWRATTLDGKFLLTTALGDLEMYDPVSGLTSNLGPHGFGALAYGLEIDVDGTVCLGGFQPGTIGTEVDDAGDPHEGPLEARTASVPRRKAEGQSAPVLRWSRGAWPLGWCGARRSSR
ncbi:MAG: hypothetical protein R3F49_24075 [Planctomycetota bacterium]